MHKITALLLAGLLSTTLLAEETSVNAMQKLNFMKGVWVGEATGIGADRKPFSVTQTERVGAMLDGEVLVVEGRGYRNATELAFSAFGVISVNSNNTGYEMRAYSQGKASTFNMQYDGQKLIWEKPLPNGAVMRYTIVISDNSWHEIGEFVMAGQPPRQMLEMTLKRVGDTDWPAANPVRP